MMADCEVGDLQDYMRQISELCIDLLADDPEFPDLVAFLFDGWTIPYIIFEKWEIPGEKSKEIKFGYLRSSQKDFDSRYAKELFDYMLKLRADTFNINPNIMAVVPFSDRKTELLCLGRPVEMCDYQSITKVEVIDYDKQGRLIRIYSPPKERLDMILGRV